MIYTHKLSGLKFAIGLGIAMAPAATLATVAKPPQFAQCVVCHKVGPTEKSTIGPNLFNVGGRGVGKLAGFNYSPAFKSAGGNWSKARLVAYLQDPKKAIPGNRMAFPGIKDPKVAGAVADYVLSLK